MGTFNLQSYMKGGSGTTAPVPTQTYNASNIFGTAIPQVGDSKARPAYSPTGGTSTKQVVLVVLFLIFIGYLLYHLSFEK